MADTAGPRPKRQALKRVVIVLQRQANLLEMVAALHAAGGLAGGLHGGQQQRDQHADDGDHHQQLDKSETTFSHTPAP